MNYLGIDYGTKNIGLAIGTDNIGVAVPMCIVNNGNLDSVVNEIANFIKVREIDVVVIGFVKDGNKKLQQEIKQFVEKLKEKNNDIQIIMEDESFTSNKIREEYREKTGRNPKGKIDNKSAALILQSYLDFNLNNK